MAKAAENGSNGTATRMKAVTGGLDVRRSAGRWKFEDERLKKMWLQDDQCVREQK